MSAQPKSTGPTIEIMEGLAMYPAVHRPNTANGDNKFTTDLLLDEEGVARAKELGFKVKKKKAVTIDEDMDEDEIKSAERRNKVKDLYESFKDRGFKGQYINVKLNAVNPQTQEARQLTVVDSQKNPIDSSTLIGNGSRVKVKFALQNAEILQAEGRPVPDYMKKYGAQAYFVSGEQTTMQVLDLVPYESENKDSSNDVDFDKEDGFKATPAKSSTENQSVDDIDEDDIPF